MKAGAAITNAERWMLVAQEYQKKYELLKKKASGQAQIIRDFQDSLDQIAEIAAPDRVMDSERIERTEQMVALILGHLGIPAPEPKAQEESGDEEIEEEDNDDERGEDDDEPPEVPQRIQALNNENKGKS
jgi:hypothetical protein